MTPDGRRPITSSVAVEWSNLAGRFGDHYSSLYGQTRTHTVHQNLRQHLAPPPASVVDVGGGGGDQSMPLAREGYTVTIVDPSPGMLARAADRLRREVPAVSDRVRLVEASGELTAEQLGTATFDGVLCHGVLMYVDNPAPLVSSLCALAAPDAVVSIVTKNAQSLAMRPAYDHDWDGVLAAFDAERQVNGLGLETRADTIDSVSELLAGAGFEMIAWYGVRLFTEDWGRAEAAGPPDAAVLASELEASRRDPYRQLSRLFHLVAARAPHGVEHARERTV